MTETYVTGQTPENGIAMTQPLMRNNGYVLSTFVIIYDL